MNSQTVIGYVRVSTGKQELSLEAQTVKIQQMAALRDVTLADILVEPDACAKSVEERPVILRLIEMVEARAVSTIIVAKLDRLTRSFKDLANLLDLFDRRGVGFLSVAESFDTRTSSGRLVVHIMASVAEWERERIIERTVDVLNHKRSKGERLGTLPFGFGVALDGKHLQEAPVEQRLLARMRTLRDQGQSYKQIALDLNHDGATTRAGTPWRLQYIARMLKATG